MLHLARSLSLASLLALPLFASACAANTECTTDGRCMCRDGNCVQSCPAGGCSFQCDGTNCRLDCPGGGCNLQCSPGAEVCVMTGCTSDCDVSCGGAATCSSDCTNPDTTICRTAS
jgi:hypothetical protein